MTAARRLVGIAGPPGAGKSTFARDWAQRHGAAYLPMDGFHLADVVLDRLGLRHRKGAPETFDVHGYAALLRRLKERPPHVVYAPGFDRDLEQPVAASIPIAPQPDVVVTEGNYLLLDRTEWRQVRSLLDEVWYLEVDDALRRERLVARHVEFGKSPEQARTWVDQVDEPNARLVAESSGSADRLIAL